MPAKRPCPHLESVVAAVEAAEPGLLDRLGIGRRRRRCGGGPGACYLEQGGPSPDGTYLELRLDHRESEWLMRADLRAYQPLSKGGRVVDLGSSARTHRAEADEVTGAVAIAVYRRLAARAVDAEGQPGS